MKSELNISLYSVENSSECVLRIVLNTNKSIEECQAVIASVLKDLTQELSSPGAKDCKDEVNL